MRSWNKVFEIGSPKTGTTSLGKAFEILGLKHKGLDGKMDYRFRVGNFKDILEVAKKFDAFEDFPWSRPNMYKIFDKEFPNSKFILLERDINSWIKSHAIHFSGKKVISRYSKEEKQKIIEEHLKKYKDIKDYFKDRPNDLLVMNICGGEGWEKLCPFLGLSIPNQPFPHEYKTPGKGYRIIWRFLSLIKHKFFPKKH